MNPLLKKLNHKAQNPIIVLNAPASFEPNLQSIADTTHIDRQVVPPEDGVPFIEFALFFATQQSEVDTYAQQIAPYLKGDAILWACYPKASSKRYRCDFNRDTGWAILGNYDLEGVRMIAIDEDWSALRFRKTRYIKTFTRQFAALSASGRDKQSE